ncbi:long-chain fatty acid transport protein [Methylohalomonas lacus]|uniref:Long-chain fatty acid transport protein n=1 Tax=Methylohalomonas lacus TaxID=398773 RepID=A0AAE3HKS4_9GAMM|nr:outer membrane protein transport protein [Methylohalomonas lacus]MCS3902939.1 long-chain fatty acid transport protein [Methylohalomonas lacus]
MRSYVIGAVVNCNFAQFSVKLCALIALCLFLMSSESQANGVLRNGHGAGAAALGGTNTASTQGPIDAMTGNPAGLSTLPYSAIQIGGGVAILDAEFSNSANNQVSDDTDPGILADIALNYKLGDTGFGLSLSPIAVAESNWQYVDAAGGSDGSISYGRQKHRSRFLALRAALGVAREISDGVHLGASLGVIYNENRLQAPYVFQSQPDLAGFKTLLDMETEGLGVNATFGLMVKPDPDVTLGMRYTTPTTFHTDGTARGDVSGEFGAPVLFTYDADVKTRLPDVASIGIEWQAQPQLKLNSQIDWLGWDRAFDALPVALSNGSNSAINNIVGSDRLYDNVPLDWSDSWVFRFGAEYAVSDNTLLRAGYSYGESPVPSSTLTPLTAAISEHILGIGIGQRVGNYQLDLSYQWNLPASQSVNRSALLSGEYDNSRVAVSTHWLTFNISFVNPFVR